MLKKLFVVSLFIVACNFYAGAQQLKGDPWIFQVYKELYSRQPNAWELNINNYNSGSWNNYGELKSYVVQYQRSLSQNNLSITTTSLRNGQTAALFNQYGKSIAADVISNDGGSIVATGGGNLVAQGGGNLVAQGGGNLASLPGVSFGSSYTIQSTGTKVIPVSGKGALIIR